jgi:DNA-binding MarR family transcriptional regulator
MTPPTQGDRDLARALSELHCEIDVLHSQVARRFGLTMQQAKVLLRLDGQPPTFGELATALGCDKTNITGMVDRLDRLGLVHRVPDTNDRRAVRAELTEHGAALTADIRTAFADAIARRWQRLPRTERGQLTMLLHDATLLLRQHRSD